MWVQIAIAIISMIASYAITASMMPKPEAPEAGALDIPTPKAGDTIPWVFGTELIKDSNVAWYGDLGTNPIYPDSGSKK